MAAGGGIAGAAALALADAGGRVVLTDIGQHHLTIVKVVDVLVKGVGDMAARHVSWRDVTPVAIDVQTAWRACE